MTVSENVEKDSQNVVVRDRSREPFERQQTVRGTRPSTFSQIGSPVLLLEKPSRTRKIINWLKHKGSMKYIKWSRCLNRKSGHKIATVMHKSSQMSHRIERYATRWGWARFLLIAACIGSVGRQSRLCIYYKLALYIIRNRTHPWSYFSCVLCSPPPASCTASISPWLSADRDYPTETLGDCTILEDQTQPSPLSVLVKFPMRMRNPGLVLHESRKKLADDFIRTWYEVVLNIVRKFTIKSLHCLS